MLELRVLLGVCVLLGVGVPVAVVLVLVTAEVELDLDALVVSVVLADLNFTLEGEGVRVRKVGVPDAVCRDVLLAVPVLVWEGVEVGDRVGSGADAVAVREGV